MVSEFSLKIPHNIPSPSLFVFLILNDIFVQSHSFYYMLSRSVVLDPTNRLVGMWLSSYYIDALHLLFVGQERCSDVFNLMVT